MAHIESGGSRGRKTNIELNLVPFIDLMSVLITFLLITAVWTQVSMIQIGSSLYGKKTSFRIFFQLNMMIYQRLYYVYSVFPHVFLI